MGYSRCFYSWFDVLQWWPGGLGKASTHALVYARLVTDNKDHGIHGKDLRFLIYVFWYRLHEDDVFLSFGALGVSMCSLYILEIYI